jgi:hypothetical protein
MLLWNLLLSVALGGTLDEWAKASSLVLDGTVVHVRYSYDERHQMPTTVWGIQIHESLKGTVKTGWIEISSLGQGMLPDGTLQDAPPHGLHMFPGDRILVLGRPTVDSTKVELIGQVGPLLVAAAGPDGRLYAHKDDSGARRPLGPCGVGQGLSGTPLLGSVKGLHWEELALREKEMTDWTRVCQWTTLMGTLRATVSQQAQPAAVIEGVPARAPGEHLLDGTIRPISGGGR